MSDNINPEQAMHAAACDIRILRAREDVHMNNDYSANEKWTSHWREIIVGWKYEGEFT